MSLDQFYTTEDTVNKILLQFDFSQYDLIIEPSAGNGAFSSRLPAEKLLAIDIDPKADHILKEDFLQFCYNGNVARDKILCIGNPPYAGKCFKDTNKSEQSHYFIKLENENLDAIMTNLNSYNWTHNNTTGPRSISKQELNAVLNEVIRDQNKI